MTPWKSWWWDLFSQMRFRLFQRTPTFESSLYATSLTLVHVSANQKKKNLKRILAFTKKKEKRRQKVMLVFSVCFVAGVTGGSETDTTKLPPKLHSASQH